MKIKITNNGVTTLERDDVSTIEDHGGAYTIKCWDGNIIYAFKEDIDTFLVGNQL